MMQKFLTFGSTGRQVVQNAAAVPSIADCSISSCLGDGRAAPK